MAGIFATWLSDGGGWRPWLWRGALWPGALAAGVAAGVLLSPKPPLLDGVPFSIRVVDRHDRLLRLTLASDDTYRVRVPLGELPPTLVKATLLHEDQWFWWHPGVNPIALAKAGWNHLARGGGRYGASTITMQLARRKGALNTRNPAGKIVQILHALQIERHYSKREILEAYFNLAPYGGNIEGAAAASYVYFHRPPARLTFTEMLNLSVIPQSPARRGPKLGHQADFLAKARGDLFARWVAIHPEDAEKASLLEMPARFSTPRKLPFLAPHATTRLMKEAPPGRHVIRATLDIQLQRQVERQIDRAIEARRRDGITNASVALLDAESLEVLAAVGSADFFDPAIQGQVDAMAMRRSPGSALKPFVYGLAFEHGIAHPHSLVLDIPASYHGYNPENYDRDFVGPVAAWSALVQSRNVPAVDLNARLPGSNLYPLLVAAEIGGLRGPEHYGLTLALGSAEVTPVELAELYAALANRGMYRPARHALDAPPAPPRRLLSAEAAWLTLDCLRRAAPPDRARPGTPGQRYPMAWKTGTSFSHRDAWTAGLAGRFVLVVWVGDFAGRSNPAFSGRSAALPLFMAIAEALPHSEETPFWQKAGGLNIEAVEVCDLSGGLATPHCPHCVKSFFIPGVSPIEKCTVHREIYVDPSTGLRVAQEHAKPSAVRKVAEFWPSDLRALFAKAGLPRTPPPPFAQDSAPQGSAAAASDAMAPRILSPRAGVEYASAHGNGPVLALQAAADASASAVYWFSGTHFLGTSRPHETLPWRPVPGQHPLTVVDDHGRARAMNVTVR